MHAPRVNSRAPVIIAQAGDDRAGVPREAQHAALVKVLREAAPLLTGSGVTLTLEPLNDRVDHPGYYLTSTVEGLDIISTRSTALRPAVTTSIIQQ